MDKELYQKPKMVKFSTWVNAVRGEQYCIGGHCIGADAPFPCSSKDENENDPCFGLDSWGVI